MLFLISGMLGSNQSLYIKHIIKDAFYNRGYDIAMISFRGMSGAKLVSPMIHNAMAINDIKEPMNYVHDKYCRPFNRQSYAIGCSMGAKMLSNLLGTEKENSVLSGAACV